METRLHYPPPTSSGRLKIPDTENSWKKQKKFFSYLLPKFSESFKDQERIFDNGAISEIPEINGRSSKSKAFPSSKNDFQVGRIHSNQSIKVLKNIGFVEKDKFKLDLVFECLNGKSSVAEICRREGIPIDLLRNWNKDYLSRVSSKEDSFASGSEKLFFQERRNYLTATYGDEVVDFIESYVALSSQNTEIVSREDLAKNLRITEYPKSFLCLYRMNDIRYINKHFEQLSEKMNVGDTLIGCLETLSARRHRMKLARIPLLGSFYFGAEFLLKRVMPKLKWTKRVYFNLSKGKDRLLSKAEGLGRLVCCGFEIMDYKSIDGLLYFVVRKERSPVYDMSPSYGPIYAMPRLGKEGKLIRVLKLRTMHPYSEYLQDYIVRAHGYAESGKPADDFRIPKWGKFMRRFWLDELPQLINFLKGDLKLVGVRPVSERYFRDIPREMQKLRMTQKPGCIPPYVALNRSGNVMSVLQSEKEYLEEKIRNPFTTDTKFFIKALYNIVVKQKRSA